MGSKESKNNRSVPVSGRARIHAGFRAVECSPERSQGATRGAWSTKIDAALAEPPLVAGGQGRTAEQIEQDARGAMVVVVFALGALGVLAVAACAGVVL